MEPPACAAQRLAGLSSAPPSSISRAHTAHAAPPRAARHSSMSARPPRLSASSPDKAPLRPRDLIRAPGSSPQQQTRRGRAGREGEEKDTHVHTGVQQAASHWPGHACTHPQNHAHTYTAMHTPAHTAWEQPHRPQAHTPLLNIPEPTPHTTQPRTKPAYHTATHLSHAHTPTSHCHTYPSHTPQLCTLLCNVGPYIRTETPPPDVHTNPTQKAQEEQEAGHGQRQQGRDR